MILGINGKEPAEHTFKYCRTLQEARHLGLTPLHVWLLS